MSAAPRRETLSLVHVTTAHGELVTTPEHPFAKIGAGWVQARALASGDLVRSGTHGVIPITSVRFESLQSPVPVFNLSVERSHAFFVGADATLVHNTQCGRDDDYEARKAAEIEATQRELEQLENTPATSPEHAAEIERKKAELKALVKKLKRHVWERKRYWARHPGKEGPDSMLRTATDDLQKLEQSRPATDEQRVELEKQKADATAKVRRLERAARQAQRDRELPSTRHTNDPNTVEASLRTKRAELERMQRELEELEHRQPASEEDQLELARRKAEMEASIGKLTREIGFLTKDAESAREIAQAEQRLKELKKLRQPSAEQQAEMRDLRERIRKLKKLAAQRRRQRHERTGKAPDPREREQLRLFARKRVRSTAYEEDWKRPPDKIELIEAELALAHEGTTPEQAHRAQVLEQRLADLKRTVELQREMVRLNQRLSRSRRKRATLPDGSPEAAKLDRQIAEAERQREQNRKEIRFLRAREVLNGKREAAGSLDPARLAELERELFADDSENIDPVRLAEIERELLGADGVDEALLTEIERELFSDDGGSIDEATLAQREREFWGELEGEREHLRGELESERADVDNAARALREDLARPPSPERRSSVQDSIHRLQQELSDERRSFEANDFALANEYAFLNVTTRRPAGSSSTAPDAMEHIRQQRLQLRRGWQARIESRLSEARRGLRDVLSNPAFRDEDLEAELSHHIALLEHELAHGP